MSKIVRNEAFARLSQQRMKALRYYTLEIDGDAGTGTVSAFEALVANARPAPVLITPAPSPEAPPAPAEGVFNTTSVEKLRGIRVPLPGVMIAARKLAVFDIIEGVRTLDRQRELFARGASKTMNSRHLTGHAVDIWPIDPATGRRVHDEDARERDRLLWLHLARIAEIVKRIAREQGVQIDWGGDWGWDAPHFELNRARYP
jgi:peptidoglycan L-alanyl-D-glutamate endopeptidase CwlK